MKVYSTCLVHPVRLPEYEECVHYEIALQEKNRRILKVVDVDLQVNPDSVDGFELHFYLLTAEGFGATEFGLTLTEVGNELSPPDVRTDLSFLGRVTDGWRQFMLFQHQVQSVIHQPMSANVIRQTSGQ